MGGASVHTSVSNASTRLYSDIDHEPTSRAGFSRHRQAETQAVRVSRKAPLSTSADCYPSTVTVARCLMSQELAPTITSNSPVDTTNLCERTSHMLISRGISVSVTSSDAPGARFAVLLNPFSCFGGSPASAGNRKYSCGVSLPATEPAFVTENVTATDPRSSDERTSNSPYENCVKDIPCANRRTHKVSWLFRQEQTNAQLRAWR